MTVMMTLPSKNITISAAMETMSEEDLVFIAAYNFSLLEVMCNAWSLEIQLEKESKLENFDLEE